MSSTEIQLRVSKISMVEVRHEIGDHLTDTDGFRFPIYTVSQILGAFCAAAVVYGDYKSAIDAFVISRSSRMEAEILIPCTAMREVPTFGLCRATVQQPPPAFSAHIRRHS